MDGQHLFNTIEDVIKLPKSDKDLFQPFVE